MRYYHFTYFLAKTFIVYFFHQVRSNVD